MKKPKVVVIGGGTGSFIVLSGLKNYPVSLSAVVAMTDSGGSTGRLRDQLGVLPPGDLRQALVALSESEQIWRKLFTYRFENGDLGGHNFGNIFLSSLEKITGSLDKSVAIAMELLKTKGQVVPVTLSDATLCAKYADGTIVEGQNFIDNDEISRAKINYMYLQPSVTINKKAESTIKKADYLIFGPGDLYGSIISNLLVDGVLDAINASKAKKIFFINLMTKRGQTEGYTASTFVDELSKYLGGIKFEFILVNNKNIDPHVTDWYLQSGGSAPVKDDLEQKKYSNTNIIKTDLLNNTKHEQSLSDKVKRSLIRHDSDKVAKTLMKIFWE